MTTASYQPGTAGIDVNITAGDETDHGSDALLFLNVNKRVLIKFDISDISSSAICTSATMSLYSYVTSTMTGDTWTAYPILSANSAWDESATWNTIDGATAWAGSSGCSTSGTDYNATSIGSSVMNDSWLTNNQFNLTPSVVTTWFGGSNSNYGMVVFTNAPLHTGTVYSSDEATYVTYRPKLVVNYTIASIAHRRTFSSMGTRIGSRSATK